MLRLPQHRDARGGIPEVVADGVSGVLVAPGDAAALVRAVETVISDPAQRIAPGEAARHRAYFFRPASSSRYEAI